MVTSNFTNMFRVPELRKRLVFTLALLAVYRLGIFLTTPGVDRLAMRRVMQGSGGLLGLFNLFSGGGLEQLSVFALNVMPYISATIILQLLTVVIPSLEKMQKEGELGRQKINQYSRYLTVVLALLQGYGIASYLESLHDMTGAPVVPEPGLGFRLLTMISLAAGSAFLMWMGEQITERGIGNGISLIIFAGIVARIPSAIGSTWVAYSRGGQLDELTITFLAAVMLGVVALIVFFESGYRRIPVQYAKRVVGRKLYGGQSTHLPLKVNTAGVIPPIFASSILLFPATLASWFPLLATISDQMRPGTWIYNVVYVFLIIFFAYFYTAVAFNPVDVADNLKKYGGYIPGIRPGKTTAEYIDRVLTRITFGGAVYVAAVCVLPTLLINRFGVPFYFGGTALLIVVGVALDTVQQIEGHLITRHYEGLTGPRGPRIRSRGVSSGSAVNA